MVLTDRHVMPATLVDDADRSNIGPMRVEEGSDQRPLMGRVLDEVDRLSAPVGSRDFQASRTGGHTDDGPVGHLVGATCVDGHRRVRGDGWAAVAALVSVAVRGGDPQPRDAAVVVGLPTQPSRVPARRDSFGEDLLVTIHVEQGTSERAVTPLGA